MGKGLTVEPEKVADGKESSEILIVTLSSF